MVEVKLAADEDEADVDECLRLGDAMSCSAVQ